MNFLRSFRSCIKTCPTKEDLKDKLGRARAKKGMYEGDLIHGELEIGQVAGLIHKILPATEIMTEIISEYEEVKKAML